MILFLIFLNSAQIARCGACAAVAGPGACTVTPAREKKRNAKGGRREGVTFGFGL